MPPNAEPEHGADPAGEPVPSGRPSAEALDLMVIRLVGLLEKGDGTGDAAAEVDGHDAANAVEMDPVKSWSDPLIERYESLPFPKKSLLEALAVSRAIWEKNLAMPTEIGDLAQLLTISAISANFRDLLDSSQKYGLTEGDWKEDSRTEISLSTLGLSLFAPLPGDQLKSMILGALQKPPIFRDFYDSVDGRLIPKASRFRDTLIRCYKLSERDAELCRLVIAQNIMDFGMFQETGEPGFLYLRLDKVSNVIPEQDAAARMSAEPQQSEWKV
jgi:hypothetical protein